MDDPLGTFWPEVSGHPLGHATARHLLTHTAGMPLRANLKHLYGTAPRTVRDGVLREALHRPIGEAVDYSATSWPPPPERIRSVSEPPGWPSPSRSTPAT
ncbi:Beta-lactamase [Streptosporangium canum]|uniref:Beta-lactamase n=1 Tax=Streptosporangium canum TaxID=324952 RepID=A0A1I4ACY1_9ACTN|nr:serine hydrolase [Streptosporangium canum]SFK54184.1 Beta-lactamase [Streptosporangium canum]